MPTTRSVEYESCLPSEADAVVVAEVTLPKMMTRAPREVWLRRSPPAVFTADGVAHFAAPGGGGGSFGPYEYADGVANGRGVGYGGGVDFAGTAPGGGVRIRVDYYWDDPDGHHGSVDQTVTVPPDREATFDRPDGVAVRCYWGRVDRPATVPTTKGGR